jgi:DNA-binding NarL/FixJ family response regulator
MPQQELLEAVRLVHAGRRHVPTETATRLAEHLDGPDPTLKTDHDVVLPCISGDIWNTFRRLRSVLTVR